MDTTFWKRRWEINDIGFHMDRPHDYLMRFFPQLQAPPGATIFVPLCGKSLDMLWLRGQGAEVVGVELSPLAVEEFFAENDLEATRQAAGAFQRYRCEGIDILLGDLFNLSPDDLGGARSVYDRGSLVALPADLRRRYAAHLASLLPVGSRALMISYKYDQCETSGPPFSVPLEEIEALFGENFAVSLLVAEDALETHKGLQMRGITRLTEFCCLLVRK